MKQADPKPRSRDSKTPRESPPFASSEVPLYYQLGTILREQIYSGAYGAGDQLPTEAELVADYGVSRITVRQALKTLEEEGLIRREAGRGTFVTDSAAARTPLQMEGSLNELMSMGMATQVELLDLRDVAASQQDAEAFGIDIGDPVVQCTRLRYHQDRPFSYIINRLPRQIASHFRERDWQQGSILRSIEKRLGLHLRDADQSVRATLADAPLARLLGTRIGAPLLSVDRVVSTDGGRIIERVHTYYRSDIYTLTVHMTRDE